MTIQVVLVINLLQNLDKMKQIERWKKTPASGVDFVDPSDETTTKFFEISNPVTYENTYENNGDIPYEGSIEHFLNLWIEKVNEVMLEAFEELKYNAEFEDDYQILYQGIPINSCKDINSTIFGYGENKGLFTVDYCIQGVKDNIKNIYKKKKCHMVIMQQVNMIVE